MSPNRSWVVRAATPEDLPHIYACQAAAYQSYGPAGLCDERLLSLQLQAFGEGILVAISETGQLGGYATSLIVTVEPGLTWHSYAEITGDGTFSTHDPSGDTLYGADIAVHPDFRRQGIAKRLYAARRHLMERFNLRRMIAGGRIPGYRDHAGKLTPEQYCERVQSGTLHDSALSVHLAAGYRVLGVKLGYLPDAQSLNYATLLQMDNPKHHSQRHRIAASPMQRPVRKIRVCASQYEMRAVRDWEQFEQQVKFFVDAAEQYHCHFLLFPELFTAQLFSSMQSGLAPQQAVAQLADLTGRYCELLSKLARSTGLFIIGGSHPTRHGKAIRNTSHLFSPGGGIYTQDKLHVTPNEREHLGIEPGDSIKVFETSHATIAINICYDIEFPELARLVTLAGAEVIFVPFSTDERKAYQRVRYCGQARAVENTVYTVLSGNVGNLPHVDNFLINYGEAAICTPCDFAFPMDGVAARADTHTETVVIGDLDLVALEEARDQGTVRPLRERRPDLYQLQSTTPVQRVRVL